MTDAPSYRGVPRERFLESVHMALGLLERHSIGYYCKSMTNGLREKQNRLGSLTTFEYLEKQQSSHGFRCAVEITALHGFFSNFFDVMAYHALRNTDGQGREAFDRLQEWSAMSPGTMHRRCPRELMLEKGVWLFNRYVEKVAQEKHDPRVIDLRETFALFAQRKGAPGRRLSTALHLRRAVHAAARGKGEAAVGAVFRSVSGDDRLWLFHAACHAAKLDPGILDIEGRGVRDYCIPWKLADKGMNEALLFAKYDLDAVLSHFRDSGQAGIARVGTLECGGETLQGVVFRANLQAARQVARTFPEKYIYDGRGMLVSDDPPLHPAGPRMDCR